MPFVFLCSQCRAMLYEDPKPVLRDGTYRRETYLEGIVTKIGGKCPRCGRRLHLPPIKIEVSPPKLRSNCREKKRQSQLDPHGIPASDSTND